MIIRFIFLTLAILAPLSVEAAQRIAPNSKEQMQLSFAPVVKAVAPSVVNIYTKRIVTTRQQSPFGRNPFFSPFFRDDFFGGRMRQRVESSLGSGVIVDSTGLVITNEHVIDEAEEITVVLSDGREFDAELALADQASDLALLRINPEKEDNLPAITLKSSESLEVGDIVLAIGNPFGVGQTVTSGIISAQGRSSLNVNDFNFFIQTDAAINPGNSGGALVALDGSVVGINTAIYSRDGGSLGIGFAVPAEMVASVIAAEQQGQTGKQGVIRPWLGVEAQDVTADIAKSLGLEKPTGVLIVALHKLSPLKKSGLRVGDIVTQMNGKNIRSASEMKFRMATTPLGEHANIEILREEKHKKFEIEAIAPPNKPARNSTKIEGNNALSGAIIANINPALAAELGLSLEEEEGVVILDISSNSYARRLVRKGDILLNINGRTIKKVEDVGKAFKKQGTQALSLTINSRGRTKKITVR